MPWIGLDDTDTLSGGCTTYEFHTLIEELSKLSKAGSPWGVPQDPRLVRLWPFASKRTRGNAALALKIEPKEGQEEHLITFLANWYESLKQRISKLQVTQSHHSERHQYPPEPCMIYIKNQNPDFYWSAVRGKVLFEEAKNIAMSDESTRIWGTDGKMSGLIGSLAAISWTGSNDFTWELTAYRLKENMNVERKICIKSVESMSERFPNTILNRDPTSKKPLISPNTPCPVLYGIRSENENDAKLAHDYLQSFDKNELSSSFQIWRTNQATGDHIKETFEGYLKSNPKVLKGGHVLLEVDSINPKMNIETLIAFEESGEVKKLATYLIEGDKIGWQGLKCPSGEIHLERLKLIEGVVRSKKRPKCDCGGRYESSGKNQPLRCKCGKIFARLWVGKKIKLSGWKEPKPSNRRHLSKPLNRS